MKSKLTLLVLLFIYLFFNYANGAEGVINGSVSFSKSDLKFEKVDHFQIVTLRECDITRGVGEPQLPVKLVHVALPPGTKVADVKIVSVESEQISGKFELYPAQPPQILSKTDKIDFVAPKAEIYSSSLPFPEQVIKYAGAGSMSGYQLVSLLIYPLQYMPAQNQLIFYSRLEFSIRYTQDSKALQLMKPRSKVIQRSFREVVEQIVLNPEDVKSEAIQEQLNISLLSEVVEYIIITHENFVQHFQPLADWKTRKGIPTKIVTTNWIYNNYTGKDSQEKIRNFIHDAYQNWGTIWILLGGDTNIVPARVAFAMDCQMGGSYDNNIPCDLYYSDLDGNWNANGNGIYGEVDDEVDLYPEVWVGRAPVDNATEVQALVKKILNYEKPTITDHFLKVLFAAEILWSNPYTDAGIGKNMIDEECLPARFDPITKLYDSMGNESRTTVIDAINAGQHIINHDGHAWYSTMSVGQGGLSPDDMDALSNFPRCSILYSIGCWPAAFDHDCIAEHFVNNPNGGGVAFIGNSRYGWGSPGNPGYGYSDRFDHEFYRKLFHDHISHIGATLAMAKAHYIPKSQQENVYRWHQYQVNLLGEPEMDIWTDTPKTMMVDHPAAVPSDTSLFTVTVTDDMNPLENALVCIMNDQNIYQYGRTNASGQVQFHISTTSMDTIHVTATAHNFLPYQGHALVQTDEPWVNYFEHTIDDMTGGNGDGTLNPGETIDMAITLKNSGNQVANGVRAVLKTSDPLVTISDSLKIYGDIAAVATSTSSAGFQFSVSSQAENAQRISFTLDIEDATSYRWSHALKLVVAAPILMCEAYVVNDSSGNANGIAEPGENVELLITLKNMGLSLARNVEASVRSFDPHIQIIDSLINFGDIQIDSKSSGYLPVKINQNCSVPCFPSIKLNIKTSEGYNFPESFVLGIGETGFNDDMEHGEGTWQHGGMADKWHITQRRSHSGDYSWYCGTEQTGQYTNAMNCYLVTPTIVLGPKSQLSFWHWYQVTTYGVDGIYVEIDAGAGWEVLDFIGSGGALNPLLDIGNDWLPDSYDLSSYPAGTPVKIRFRFSSDNNDISEGFYIDDVSVSSDYSHLSPLVVPVPLYFVDDDSLGESLGNANGFVDPGETIELPIKLKNIGDAMAAGITATIDTRDPHITLMDNFEIFGDLAPGDTIKCEDDFVFSIASNVSSHHLVSFSLWIQDSRGNSWEYDFNIAVAPRPEIQFHKFTVDDDSLGQSAGNANGFVDAGETVELAVSLKNYGDAVATGITAEISTADPYVTVLDSVATYQDIGPDQITQSDDHFVFSVSRDAPPQRMIFFPLQIKNSQGIYWTDSMFVQVTMPVLKIFKLSVNDVNGDGDHAADPGETCQLYLHLSNSGGREASQIEAILSTHCSEITISDSTAIFSNIAVDSANANYNDPFIFDISESISSNTVRFNLHITEGNGAYVTNVIFNLFLSQGKILLVVDDGKVNNSAYYTTALGNLGIPHDQWHVDLNGDVPLDTLMKFKNVIWFTGKEPVNTLTTNDQQNLESYLNSGGNLFLSGQFLGINIGSTSFFSDYLHAKYIFFYTKLHHLKGVPGNEVVGEMDISLATFGDNAQHPTGEIDPIAPAFSIFKYDTTTVEGPGDIRSSGTGAIALNTGSYKVVFFSFGFEGIDNAEDRMAVMANIVSWFSTITDVREDFVDKIPLQYSLSQNYPNPFNSSTIIKFQLPADSHVNLRIYNILGKEVCTLVNEKRSSGYHYIQWDGRDNQGNMASSGIYLYQLTIQSGSGKAAEFTATRKLVILK